MEKKAYAVRVFRARRARPGTAGGGVGGWREVARFPVKSRRKEIDAYRKAMQKCKRTKFGIVLAITGRRETVIWRAPDANTALFRPPPLPPHVGGLRDPAGTEALAQIRRDRRREHAEKSPPRTAREKEHADNFAGVGDIAARLLREAQSA